jgi:deoxyribonuclease-1
MGANIIESPWFGQSTFKKPTNVTSGREQPAFIDLPWGLDFNSAMNRVFSMLALVAFFAVQASVAFSAPPEVLSIRGNHNIEDFNRAKKALHKIFDGYEETLYCGCRYYGKELNLNSCGISIPDAPKRLKRLEWEHMVPAAKFGEAIKAWITGDDVCVESSSGKGHKHSGAKGRKCAEKASPLFRQMEGDLYNLWPESGEVNGARSNKPPRESVEVTRTFGTCGTKIGKKYFEPRKEVRGIVARAYLYMNWAYEVSVSEDEKTMFEKWDRDNPPTPWECERTERIKRVQGNANPFTEKACRS